MGKQSAQAKEVYLEWHEFLHICKHERKSTFTSWISNNLDFAAK